MAAIEIGAFAFASKRDAQSEIRRILHDTPIRQPLQGHDLELIAALVGLHHAAEEKIGPGIATIDVRQIDYGARGFWITRTDGSSIDFSYRTALNGAGNHRAQCLRAMRSAVRDQVLDFRRAAFAQGPQVCPLTDQVLTNDPSTHVDHVTDFSVLADFFTSYVGGYGAITISNSVTHPGPAMAEPHLTQWRRFHADRAQLRLVHGSANLARHRRTA